MRTRKDNWSNQMQNFGEEDDLDQLEDSSCGTKQHSCSLGDEDDEEQRRAELDCRSAFSPKGERNSNLYDVEMAAALSKKRGIPRIHENDW